MPSAKDRSKAIVNTFAAGRGNGAFPNVPRRDVASGLGRGQSRNSQHAAGGRESEQTSGSAEHGLFLISDRGRATPVPS